MPPSFSLCASFVSRQVDMVKDTLLHYTRLQREKALQYHDRPFFLAIVKVSWQMSRTSQPWLFVSLWIIKWNVRPEHMSDVERNLKFLFVFVGEEEYVCPALGPQRGHSGPIQTVILKWRSVPHTERPIYLREGGDADPLSPRQNEHLFIYSVFCAHLITL